ncbi:MAG: hypothetical protein JHC95_09735 [Solirubrobacteraceae bacterium]|nr:hypothetical protein [Solirubrobacteraceae bacterium]
MVAPDEVAGAAREAAQTLTGVNADAHRDTKLRVRERVLAGVRDGAVRLETGQPADW